VLAAGRAGGVYSNETPGAGETYTPHFADTASRLRSRFKKIPITEI